MAVSSLQRLVGCGHWSGISLIQRVFFTWQLSLTPQEPLGNTSKSSLLFSPTCIQSPCPSLFQPVPSRAWTPLPVAVLRLWGISAPHFRLHLWTFEETSPAWLYAAKGIKANPPFLSDCFKTHSHFFDMSFMSLREANPYHFSCFFIKFINGLWPPPPLVL